MARLNKLTFTGLFLCFCLFTIGFGIGWLNKNTEWNQELEQAADKIAAHSNGMYVREFRGVVYLGLPRETTESERDMINRICDQFDN